MEKQGSRDAEGEIPSSLSSEDDKGKIGSEKKEKGAPNPLKWFGILVPPTLRTSQQSFRNAVNQTIPDLASIIAEMRETEIEIRRTRKKIGKIQPEKP